MLRFLTAVTLLLLLAKRLSLPETRYGPLFSLVGFFAVLATAVSLRPTPITAATLAPATVPLPVWGVVLELPAEVPALTIAAPVLVQPAAPVEEPSLKLTALAYVVEPGDSLLLIANSFDLDILTVLSANPELASSPDSLPIGAELLIPPMRGAMVTVASGDTLADLADSFGVDPLRVVQFNELVDADNLLVGTRLFLPGARADRIALQVPVQPSNGVPGFRPVWPAGGDISTYFGEVGWTSPRGHQGLDLDSGYGAPVRAAESGAITSAGWNSGGYGYMIAINHASSFETSYAHLSRILVAPGQKVQRGEVIGYVGSTGFVTGPHLHFEVREAGRLRDPLRYLP